MFFRKLSCVGALLFALSSSSQAYFGQEYVDSLSSISEKAVAWVKENPKKTALGVVVLGVAGCGLYYWGKTNAQDLDGVSHLKPIIFNKETLDAGQIKAQECYDAHKPRNKTIKELKPFVSCLFGLNDPAAFVGAVLDKKIPIYDAYSFVINGNAADSMPYLQALVGANLKDDRALNVAAFGKSWDAFRFLVKQGFRDDLVANLLTGNPAELKFFLRHGHFEEANEITRDFCVGQNKQGVDLGLTQEIKDLFLQTKVCGGKGFPHASQ